MNSMQIQRHVGEVLYNYAEGSRELPSSPSDSPQDSLSGVISGRQHFGRLRGSRDAITVVSALLALLQNMMKSCRPQRNRSQPAARTSAVCGVSSMVP